MEPAAPTLVERDMGSSHAEFFRILPNALGNENYRREENAISVPFESGKVLITLGVERQRKIANMTIPHTQVRLAFSNLNPEQVRRFIERFDRYYHRGGG